MKPLLAWATLLSLAGCLSGEPPAMLKATAIAEGTQVRFLTDASDANLVEIRCEPGTGRVIVERGMAAWPAQVTVRLHLRGLEAFRVQSNETTLVWSISSHGDATVRVSLRTPTGETDVKRDSPYYADVRIVGERRQIPLENGYFEVALPHKLLAGNPASISLSWVDFYRQ